MKSAPNSVKNRPGDFWRRSGASRGAQGVPDRILGVKSWFVGPPLDWWGFRVFFNAKLVWFVVWFLEAFWSDFATILDSKMHPTVGQNWKMCVSDFERLVYASSIMEILGLQNR